ncbi:hypothetical protein R1sor_013840 [Riccia sorocarpa]|uniref:RING-type domain-containing protein n=1 Tax=Riccia sorocarpa TaxID=122646 RepID=A0ABD3H9L7_9MARC
MSLFGSKEKLSNTLALLNSGKANARRGDMDIWTSSSLLQTSRKCEGHSESIANCDELNFFVTRNEKPVYPTDYDDFLEARKLGLKGSQWEKYAGVIRDDLEVKCLVCQDYIGLLPHMCPGTCACKYHISCFWPAASRRSVCTICKVPFASKTYEFFNTRHIPPASKGSINPDTGELELDADQALDSEIHADVMAGRRDSFGPNNVDRARQSEDEKLWRRLFYNFLQIWHHGNGDVKFHTRHMKMEDQSPRSALERTHNRLVLRNDDDENDETYKPTAKSKASGSRKRVAHKPPKRGLRKPDAAEATDSDEEPLAKKAQRLRKRNPQTVVEDSETDGSPQQDSETEDSKGEETQEYEEAKSDEESSEHEEEASPSMPQAIDSTPEVDRVEANTEVTPDEEVLATNTPLSSATLAKRKAVHFAQDLEGSKKKRLLSSDEESPGQFTFDTSTEGELTPTKTSLTGMMTSLVELADVVKRLEDESKDLGVLLSSPGDYNRFLAEIVEGWKKESSTHKELTALRREFDELVKTSDASTKTLRSKLKEVKAEAKHDRKKKKSTHKKLEACRAEIETKTAEREDMESRAKTSDAKSILEAAKIQPEAQTERHARYRRVAERALANYQALASTLDVKLDKLRELVDPGWTKRTSSSEETRSVVAAVNELTQDLNEELGKQTLEAMTQSEVQSKNSQDAGTSTSRELSPKKKDKAVGVVTRISPRTKTSVASGSGKLRPASR